MKEIKHRLRKIKKLEKKGIKSADRERRRIQKLIKVGDIKCLSVG